MTLHRIQYGETTIEYQLTYSNRKTLAIHVHPDLQVVVVAPHDTSLEVVQAKVHQRANWIVRQQREFELYLPKIPPRQYVSGETHRYLGRQYRLRVVQEADADWVKLERGYLHVRTRHKRNTEAIRTLVNGWYLRQARRVFHERLRELLPRFANFNLPKFEIRVHELQTRWGSCTEAGTITLNLKLMQVPKAYIDYVIVHELCHLLEHNHSKRFYALLDRVLPDWRDRRQKLNQYSFS
ncbi:MAG: M48 family metallopeptidase [Anaerolineae bacterium]|nr:M48 family metallopeptidase [Anaerolineae bacterium]